MVTRDFIGKCPNCGNENIEVIWIGECRQEINKWNGNNPKWFKTPIYGDLTDWDMEWDTDKSFSCPNCETEFNYEDIIFEEV